VKPNLFQIAWIGAVVTVVTLSILYNGNSNSTVFYGIAESREMAVNFERPVEIKKIHVVQGQKIHVGDTIVELDRPELILKINEIAHNLNELKAKGNLDIGENKSLIKQLQAEQAAIENEIKTKISLLEAQYKLNKELTSSLKSIESGQKDQNRESSNPIKEQIAALNQELRLALSPNQIKINMLKSSIADSANPIEIQIASLEKELNLLKEEKEHLLIFSSLNGVIGSVNYKEGEKVSPFMNIVTLHAKSPSFVKGYIHENIYSNVDIGQKVKVISISKKNSEIKGNIVGIGSRIIEFPERLRKRPDIVVWGREVIIKIVPENQFLLGEKVIITPAPLLPLGL